MEKGIFILVAITLFFYFILNQIGYRIYNNLTKTGRIKDSETSAVIYWFFRISAGIICLLLSAFILTKLNLL